MAIGALMLAGTGGVGAQSPTNPNPPGASTGGSVNLVYRRETLDYDDANRADPMQPPAKLAQTGGEVKLALAGIVYNRASPQKSKAMLRWDTGSAQAADGAPLGGRRIVQVGDTIDVYRVVSIRENSVLLQVSSLGGPRNLVLERTTGERKQPGAGKSRGTRVTESEETQQAVSQNPPTQQPQGPSTGIATEGTRPRTGPRPMGQSPSQNGVSGLPQRRPM